MRTLRARPPMADARCSDVTHDRARWLDFGQWPREPGQGRRFRALASWTGVGGFARSNIINIMNISLALIYVKMNTHMFKCG